MAWTRRRPGRVAAPTESQLMRHLECPQLRRPVFLSFTSIETHAGERVRALPGLREDEFSIARASTENVSVSAERVPRSSHASSHYHDTSGRRWGSTEEEFAVCLLALQESGHGAALSRKRGRATLQRTLRLTVRPPAPAAHPTSESRLDDDGTHTLWLEPSCHRSKCFSPWQDEDWMRPPFVPPRCAP